MLHVGLYETVICDRSLKFRRQNSVVKTSAVGRGPPGGAGHTMVQPAQWWIRPWLWCCSGVSLSATPTQCLQYYTSRSCWQL